MKNEKIDEIVARMLDFLSNSAVNRDAIDFIKNISMKTAHQVFKGDTEFFHEMQNILTKNDQTEEQKNSIISDWLNCQKNQEQDKLQVVYQKLFIEKRAPTGEIDLQFNKILFLNLNTVFQGETLATTASIHSNENIPGSSELASLFNKLNSITTTNIGQTLSANWATGHGINEALNQSLGNSVHAIHPDSSSVHSPASIDTDNALEGAVSYAKMIGGYIVDGETIENGFIGQDGGVLKKPIVMILNTTVVSAKSSTDSIAIGGVHWQCCVILPRNYEPMLEEQPLNNPEEIIFYLDSLHPNVKMPERLKHILKNGLEYSFESDDGVRTHKIPTMFPNAKVIDGRSTKQQLEGSDCGWWAIYNAMMLVFTGRIDFLNQFEAPSREPAYKLRTLFPSLGDQLEMQSDKDMQEESVEEIYEGVNKLEFLAIQAAIEASLNEKQEATNQKKENTAAKQKISPNKSRVTNDAEIQHTTNSLKRLQITDHEEAKMENIAKRKKKNNDMTDEGDEDLDKKESEEIAMSDDQEEMRPTILDLGGLRFTLEGKRVTALDSINNYISRGNNSLRSIRDFEISWKKIPEFTVLTGANGVGKSYLLEQIKAQVLAQRPSPLKVTYLGADEVESFGSTYTLGGGITKFLQEDEKGFISFILSFIEGKKNDYESTDYSKQHRGDNGENFINAARLIAARLLRKIPDLKDREDIEKRKVIEDECRMPNFLTQSDEINYNINSIVKSSIVAHEKAREEHETALKHYSRVLDEPYSFWRRENPEGTFEGFKNFLKDANMVDKLIKRLIEKEMPIPDPLEDINKILPLTFPHKLYSKNGTIHCYPRDMNNQEKIEKKLVDLDHLSSGEKLVLKIVSLVYYNQGLRATGTDASRSIVTKPDLMLLDEPDRHLDPMSCKIFFDLVNNILVKQEGIQVIMTTHKTDTVGLAPENSLFVMDKNGAKREIRPVTKLHALFKLNKNTLFLSNVPVQVFVEGHDDAIFYDAIYRHLRHYCEEIRNSGGKKWADPFAQRVLSRRYPLSFTSVSNDDKGGGGGVTQVEKTLQLDLTARKLRREMYDKNYSNFEQWLEKTKLSIAEPHAIIDMDFKRHSIQNNHIRQLKRHSLENFVYDPFILISTNPLPDDISKNQALRDILYGLKECIKTSMGTIGNELQQLVDNYFKTILFCYTNVPLLERYKEEAKKEVGEKHWNFGFTDDATPESRKERAKGLVDKICDKVYLNKLDSNSRYDREQHFIELKNKEIKLNDKIDGKKYTEKEALKQFELLCNVVKPENLLFFRFIEEEKKKTRNIACCGTTAIDIIVDQNYILKDITYPNLFLELRGHDIACLALKKNDKANNELTKSIINKLSVSARSYIPCDLAKTIFDTDINVRKQANTVVRDRT